MVCFILFVLFVDTFDTSRPLAAMVQSLCLGIGFRAGQSFLLFLLFFIVLCYSCI